MLLLLLVLCAHTTFFLLGFLLVVGRVYVLSTGCVNIWRELASTVDKPNYQRKSQSKRNRFGVI